MIRDQLDEDQAVLDIIDRLVERFPKEPRNRISQAVDEVRDSFTRAIEREAKARLHNPI